MKKGQIVAALAVILLISGCIKEKEPALSEPLLQTDTKKSKEIEIYTSRISENRTCEVSIQRKNDGSASFSYIIRPSGAQDVFRSYTPDRAITRDGKNAAHINIETGETFHYIPFENPYSTSIATGAIVFTCECCATGTSGSAGGCMLTGTIDPFSVDCTSTSCTGECGLNAGGNLTNNTGIYIHASSLEAK